MSHDHDDYQVEPIRGLPENLPPGEQILWQGAPSWWQMAKTVFHIRAAMAYFAFLIVWRVHIRVETAPNSHAAIVAIVSLLPITIFGIGLLALLAFLCSRTSVYTITNRRLVMRVGVALPTAINIPFNLVSAAGLHLGSGGAGDIPLTIAGPDRLAYSNLWPHVRPWHVSKPEPMLRGIKDATVVANLLSGALQAALPANSVRTAVTAEAQTPPIRIAGAVGAAS